MKIKEITEGILGKIAKRLGAPDTSNPSGSFAQQTDVNPYGSLVQQFAKTVHNAGLGNPYTQYLKQRKKPQDQKGDIADITAPDANEKPTSTTPATKTSTQQSTAAKKQPTTATPAPTAPKDNPNTSIKSKVDYLVKQGVLQSGRITDDEKQYIDSVDVYVDINKFNNVDPSQKLIKSTPPHHHLTISSVQIPMKDWQEAIGRSGEGLSGYVGFDLTPAGWWSDDYKAYVNPNSNLSDLVDRYQKG